jgi:hypothetical protein
MSLSRKFFALVAPVLLLVGFSVLGAPGAGAVSTVHKFLAVGNNSTAVPPNGRAVETKAKVLVTCSAVTGIWTVKAKNISVIGQDGTAFTKDAGQFTLTLGTLAATALVHLTQNPKTELFDANAAGVIASPASWCLTGTPGINNVALSGLDSGDGFLGYLAIGDFS